MAFSLLWSSLLSRTTVLSPSAPSERPWVYSFSRQVMFLMVDSEQWVFKVKKRPTCTESDFWMLSIRLWTRSSCFSFPVTTNMQWTNIQKKNIELSRADSPSMVYKTCSYWGTNNPQQKITLKCASKEFCTGQVLHWKILLMTTRTFCNFLQQLGQSRPTAGKA